MRKFVPIQVLINPKAKPMKSIFYAFLESENGATAIEYALISSLIAVFIIAALSQLGTSLSGVFSEVGNALK